jgi:release factor glutamine methyltransferase
VSERPYRYSEDSRLLGEYLSTMEGSGSFLEIGVGGGRNLTRLELLHKFDRIVGTDLMNLAQVRKELPRSLELIVADKASCFRSGSFDIIAFNPPYLPSESIEDRAIDGGRGGVEVPLQFLDSALSVLRSGGRIIMLLSSDDSLEDLKKFCEEHDLLLAKVAETALFFEWLFVFLIIRKSRIISP